MRSAAVTIVVVVVIVVVATGRRIIRILAVRHSEHEAFAAGTRSLDTEHTFLHR